MVERKVKEKDLAAKPKKTAKGLIIAIIKVLLLLVFVGAVIMAAQFFVGNILLATMGAEMLVSSTGSAVYSALSYLVAGLVIVGVPALMEKVKGKQILQQIGFRGWPTWADIGLAPIGYIAYMLIGTGVMMIFALLFPWFDAEETQDVGFALTVVGGERVLAFVTLVVVAPIAEEIIFRGWLYEKIKRELAGRMPKWAVIAVAMVLVSVLFGIVHLQWNVGVNVFALSLILCALREITGTTYAGILLHMLKNGIAFYLLFVM